MAIMWDSGSQDAGSIPAGTTKYGFSSVGGSVGLQNQRSEVRILQPVQMRSYGVGGCLLAGLKIQRPLFDSRRAHQKYGDVGKLVDPPDLESGAARRAGSSPVIPTINNYRPRSS